MDQSGHKSPHDAAFKATLSKPEAAQSFFKCYLPAEVVRLLNWDTLLLMPGEYVDKKLRERQSDLLFSVTARTGQVFIYVLLEHQSRADRLMPLRLLEYMIRIWRENLKERPGEKLWPILPMVYYHGSDAWNAPLNFIEMLELPAELEQGVGSYVPQFRYELMDLSKHTAEELRGVEEVRGLLYLMRALLRRSDFLKSVELLATIMFELDSRQQEDEVEMLLRYGLEVSDKELSSEISEVLKRKKYERLERKQMSMAQELRQEGRQEGLQEGALFMARQNVLDVLETRFGKIPGGLGKRVDTISDVEKLRALLRAASAAKELKDFERALN